MSKAAWVANQEERFTRIGAEQACQSELFTHMVNNLESIDEADFSKAFVELLSVPRLPVMNPCL